MSRLIPKRFIPWLALLLPLVALFLIPTAATAAQRGVFQYSKSAETRLYADLQVGIQAVSHSGIDFLPNFGSASVGIWVFDNLGIDIFGDTGLMADDTGVFELQIAEASGVALRFQSPPSLGGLRAYVMLGVVNFEVEQKESDLRGQRVVIENFTGGRVSIGFAKRLAAMRSLMLTAEYRNYYSDKDLQADSLGFGLRVNLP